jgi:hypothetical protein
MTPVLTDPLLPEPYRLGAAPPSEREIIAARIASHAKWRRRRNRLRLRVLLFGRRKLRAPRRPAAQPRPVRHPVPCPAAAE